MNNQTAKSLAPKSWIAVAAWIIAAVVFVSHPQDTTAFLYRTAKGSGQWVAYQAFSECEDTPPLDWMTAKPCQTGTGQEPEPEPASLEPRDTGTDNTDTTDTGSTAGDALTYVVDGELVTDVLDAGAGLVLDLHDEVERADTAGGFAVQFGGDRP